MHFHFLYSRLARAALLVVTSLGVATAASAMSLRELRGLAKAGKQGPDYVNYYLVGVMEGALEAHAQAVRNGAAATICLNGRRLEPNNADLYEADLPVSLVMVNALSTVYRC